MSILAAIAVSLTACGGAPSLDAGLRAIIADQGLSGDPSQGRDLPSINDPLAQLGKQLFFTKALGGDKDAACASCHHPLLGGGDGLALSIGVGAVDPDLLGSGRSHPSGAPNVPRNAPTTFNCAMWDQVMFHDGRLESLDKIPGRNGAGTAGIRTPDTCPGCVIPWRAPTWSPRKAVSPSPRRPRCWVTRSRRTSPIARSAPS